MKTALSLNGWSGETEERRVCFVCQASQRATNSFREASSLAAWRGTTATHHQHLQDCAARHIEISHIWRLPGVQLEHVSLGFMHVADLGCWQYLLGNCLWEVFITLRGTRNRPDAALAE